MGNCQIYRRVNGRKIEKVMALQEDVQNKMRAHALRLTAESKAKLTAHRDTGRSRVYMVDADVDFWIVLDDPNAMQIEFGHKGYTQHRTRSDGSQYEIHVGASDPLKILRGPAGLA